MKRRTKLLLALSLLLVPIMPFHAPLRGSDHADTAENYNRPGADLADVYIFPPPGGSTANVVLVMDVHPLIQPGTVPGFDPNVLYQFKIDNTGDVIEDLVIQARFYGVGANQKVVISGPTKPSMTGTTSAFTKPYPTVGQYNTPFSPTTGMKVFAGLRSDPFFFDLARFFAILPDRMTPGTGKQVDFASIMAADTPQTVTEPDGVTYSGFRGFPPESGFDPTPAMDLLTQFNVLSIVIELPRASLIGNGNGVIRLWETTSIATGAPNFNFTQQDRLARPAVSEALATVTDSRHHYNNMVSPVQMNALGNDSTQVKTDILRFMNYPAGRSPAIANTLASVLVPDVMVANLLNTTDPATYLGVETGGATGGTFGGRALISDVIDIDLGAIFGGIIPAVTKGAVPDDGQEKPQFATDNVGPHTDYLTTFPYLGNPH